MLRLSRRTQAEADANTDDEHMNDHGPPRFVGLVPWIRVLAFVALIAGYVAFVRANNAEASAIFDAGGDAGLWDLGIIVATALLIPGAVLLLLSLVIRPRTSGSAPIAVIAGLALLVPTAWLAVNLYPPDKETDEDRRSLPRSGATSPTCTSSPSSSWA